MNKIIVSLIDYLTSRSCRFELDEARQDAAPTPVFLFSDPLGGDNFLGLAPVFREFPRLGLYIAERDAILAHSTWAGL
jgi:hypothetical protein